MSDSEFQRAIRYADKAMGLLKRGIIPPYPQFYELLYTYSTGVNPELNERINKLFNRNDNDENITDLAERLYNEFLRSNNVEERLNYVSEKISSRIDDVHSVIHTALETTSAYSGSLKNASGSLAEDLTKEQLKALAASLLSETYQMQETNNALEGRLEVAREDITSLQHDLDEVRRESMLDPLTKVQNRKAFDQGLERAITDFHASGTPLSLVMFDIDHFKSFNDNYGHQTGDQVLRLVALTMKANVKGQDLAARYGGEEFAAVLPATDLDAARKVADNIRNAIQAKELLKRSTNEKLGRITASFGVALCRPDDTAMSLVERADRCLYAAKGAGRNCVIAEDDPTLQSDAA